MNVYSTLLSIINQLVVERFLRFIQRFIIIRIKRKAVFRFIAIYDSYIWKNTAFNNWSYPRGYPTIRDYIGAFSFTAVTFFIQMIYQISLSVK